MEKIFVGNHNMASFRCPHCGYVRQFDASPYHDKANRLKIKCQCGETVPVLIEFRTFFRKAVRLYGLAKIESTISGQHRVYSTKKEFSIIVSDLSMNGLRFSLSQEHALESIVLEVDDILTISFRLDNQPKDLIERRSIIRNIYGDGSYGANFIRPEYDKALGFYLLR